MKIKEIFYIIIVLVSLNIFFGYAQKAGKQDTKQTPEQAEFHRMGQTLINYLEANRYFEARELYDSIRVKTKEIDPFIENVYRLQMCYFEYKPDSAVIYWHKLIENRYYNIGMAYCKLWQIYAEALQDYEKAFQICDSLDSYANINPDGLDESTIQDGKEHFAEYRKQTKKMATEPKIKVIRDSTSNSIPLLNVFFDNSVVEISCNNHDKIKTIFDTGFDSFFGIDNNLAKKIGVRKFSIDNDTTKFFFNDVQVLDGYTGILDSMQVANIKIYNIPVYVFDFSSFYNIDTTGMNSVLKEAVNEFRSINITMGLKTINLIGKFVLDYGNHEIYFPTENEYIPISKEKNLYRSMGKLFTQVQINNLPLTANIDIGSSSYIDIDKHFYDKHKDLIATDTINKNIIDFMLHKAYSDSIQIVAKNPSITFDGLEIEPTTYDVTIFPLEYWGAVYFGIEDCMVGNPFIKSLGKKILFDLRNMRLEVLKEN